MWKLITILMIICLPQITMADVIITNEKSTLELITIARHSWNSFEDIESSIEALNGLLLMPPSEYTQEAKELIGIAHERNGYTEKAKHDYAVYLAEYPNSDQAQYIRRRLIALEIAKPLLPINARRPNTPDVGSWSRTSGSISEYYYLGSSAPTFSRWETIQSSAITNINLTGTFKENEYLTRAVFRYSNLLNLAPVQTDTGKTSIAYIDVDDTFRGYGVKVGRQNPAPGVLGRFDGISATYRISSETDIAVQTGTPYTGSTDNRRFYGAQINQNITRELMSTTYYNYQLVGKLPERSAIGSQLRYIRDDTSLSLITEYDTIYRTINSILLQGNTVVNSIQLYTMINRQRSPTLFADRALAIDVNSINRLPYLTVSDMLANTKSSTSALYQYIDQTTPISTSYVIGASKLITKKWSISTDIQRSGMSVVPDITFTGTTDPVVARPSTAGDVTSVNIRTTGTDFLYKHNTVDLLAGISKDNISKSSSYTVLDSKSINDNMRIDVLARYNKREQSNLETVITASSIRANYKHTNTISIESQIEFSKASVKDKIAQSSNTQYNKTFLIGIRYDF